MMSHELRTPMNGVLGLIALAKQTGLTDAQKRLIEQAERAGAHMSSLLGDILDFSDLQTDRLEIDNDKYNVNGGSIAIGHPFGMTGARLTGLLLRELHRREKKLGIVSMCIGKGMGAAGLFEAC